MFILKNIFQIFSIFFKLSTENTMFSRPTDACTVQMPIVPQLQVAYCSFWGPRLPQGVTPLLPVGARLRAKSCDTS